MGKLNFIKNLRELFKRVDELEKECNKNYMAVEDLTLEVGVTSNKSKKQDRMIEKILNEIKSSPMKNDSEINFIGDDKIGGYLQEVEVYDLIKNCSNSYLSDGCKVTVSVKIEKDRAKKKEVFEAIKRVYPKLLEYFHQ